MKQGERIDENEADRLWAENMILGLLKYHDAVSPDEEWFDSHVIDLLRTINEIGGLTRHMTYKRAKWAVQCLLKEGHQHDTLHKILCAWLKWSDALYPTKHGFSRLEMAARLMSTQNQADYHASASCDYREEELRRAPVVAVTRPKRSSSGGFERPSFEFQQNANKEDAS